MAPTGLHQLGCLIHDLVIDFPAWPGCHAKTQGSSRNENFPYVVIPTTPDTGAGDGGKLFLFPN